MPQIAIIDDDVDQSGTLAKTLSIYLERNGSDLAVITQTPFHILNDYLKFVSDNDICVLILDERLNIVSVEGSDAVHYQGSELISFLRAYLKDFPIFMVSNYIEEDDLQAKFSLFDYMLTRSELTEGDGEKYIPIIIRSAQRYLNSNNKELSEFNQLTQDVAAGNQSVEKIERLQALQIKLQMPISGFDDRKVWLEEYETHIKELESLKEQLLMKIKGS